MQDPGYTRPRARFVKPNEPHQITNDGAQDLILYVVADNPLGESYYHPDSNEWTVPIPVRRVIRSEAQD